MVAWRTTAACQTTGSKPGTTDTPVAKWAYTHELKAQGSTAPTWKKSSVKGYFKHVQSYTGATKTGQTKYYWCAYLINDSTDQTFLVKGWAWSELGNGGPPGAP